MGSLFLKIHYIYMEEYLAIFMIYAYSVFRCSRFFNSFDCFWVYRSLAFHLPMEYSVALVGDAESEACVDTRLLLLNGEHGVHDTIVWFSVVHEREQA